MKKEIANVRILYLILFLSGFAGLGYEMVWTRMLSVGLGHEIIAVLSVVAAFFCGMALGAWCLDGVVSRSYRPGHWYAALELGIGLWSLILIFLIPPANHLAALLADTGSSVIRHWSVAFVLPLLLFLPATFAMGATLPAMERLFSRLRQDGWSVGGLYATNTFGAMKFVCCYGQIVNRQSFKINGYLAYQLHRIAVEKHFFLPAEFSDLCKRPDNPALVIGTHKRYKDCIRSYCFRKKLQIQRTILVYGQ